ncbi:ABC transporter ATP-binding protein [Desulfoglaeba alkanexedens]|jgi:ABC-2 type transport system ATP-binding protein|uniref:ATP-binding cassette domain-containing protein n=1 Tax=Desulfoglaeba alkanexedens ALDC TaxID=980445 RepID=A0A4P8L450_9BACT|nr:ATP-binding cassette domain-containing protein [Desulfoglaeba alkanexedens ALDC]
MAVPQIEVENLQKFYRVHHKEEGLLGSVRSLVNRRYRDVKAVDGITFSIESGEVVGFLGPNGAGKTTTLKVLSGLLYPTGGRVSILNGRPHERTPWFLKQITLVMGQKNQLLWDLPAIETFRVNQAVYDIEEGDFQAVLSELVELLELEPLLRKQVRKLSLGERMKCELAAALLHRPRVLFLDEPTIGLDVTMQVRIREFIAEYNARFGATVILTSHYMADVTALCRRVIMIDLGRLVYDGDLRLLVERMAPYKVLKIVLRTPCRRDELEVFGEVRHCNGVKAVLRVPRKEAAEAAARLLTTLDLDDVTIEEPPVEEIVSQLFGRRPPATEPGLE